MAAEGVRRATAEFTKGAITSIIGPNGAGKSTHFNLLPGALRPSSRSVEFEGRDVAGLPPAGFSPRLADRAYVLDQGAVVYQAAASELLVDNEIKERYCSFDPGLSHCNVDRRVRGAGKRPSGLDLNQGFLLQSGGKLKRINQPAFGEEYDERASSGEGQLSAFRVAAWYGAVARSAA